ncbi:MAG: hypothetical protein Q9220_005445 [cf. Caloplaca sp. 1 TL-2023]
MQNTGYDSQAYQQAANWGVPMENGWMGSELSSQPYAGDMHEGVGGLSTHPLSTDQPGLSLYPFHQALDSIVHDDNVSGHSWRAPGDSSINNYPAQEASRIGPLLSTYPCSYPGCYALFLTEFMLFEHIKVHPQQAHSNGHEFQNDGSHSVDFGHVSYGSNGLSIPTDPTAYPGGRELAKCGYAEGVSTANVPTPFDVQGSRFNGSSANDYIDDFPRHTGGSAVPIESARYMCSYEGCNISCARPGDIRRHEQKHNPGPRQFDCSKPGCSRKGYKGKKGIYWMRGTTTLLRTCKRVHDEAAALMYSRATFDVRVVWDCITFSYQWLLPNGLIPRTTYAFPDKIGHRYQPLIRNINVQILHVDSYAGMIKYNHGNFGSLIFGLKSQVESLVGVFQTFSDLRAIHVHFQDDSDTPGSDGIVLEPLLNLHGLHSITTSGDISSEICQRLQVGATKDTG